MNLVLIGPVYPYKGGISHYTSLLCTALRKNHNVHMISYSMQYPKLLFKKEQRDYSNSMFKVDDTNFLINTANPFNILASARKIKKLKPDAVIIQWWHPYFAPCYYILAKALGKIPVIFTCHNVFPHERFPMDRKLTKLVLKQGKGFITQSNMDKDDLLSIKADANYVVTPHPTYNAFRINDISKSDARGILEINADTPVLLFFGFVREYKGLHYLIDALKFVKDQIPDIELLVVGDFSSDKEEYLNQISANGLENNIKVVDGYVPDEEVEKYFAACDLVVLPYSSATQSGIAQIAYGFEKPVVVTNVGGLPDVVDDGVTGYIVPPMNPEAIAEAIKKYFSDNDIPWAENIAVKAEEFSWETMVKKIEKLIENI